MLVSSVHWRNQMWFATVLREIKNPLKLHGFRGRTIYALDMGAAITSMVEMPHLSPYNKLTEIP